MDIHSTAYLLSLVLLTGYLISKKETLFYISVFPLVIFLTLSLIHRINEPVYIIGYVSIIVFIIYFFYIKYSSERRELLTDIEQRIFEGSLIAGYIYYSLLYIERVEQFLIETVTGKTVFFLEILGYSPSTRVDQTGFEREIVFETADFGTLVTHIEEDCTGIGSIAIVVGFLWFIGLRGRKLVIWMLLMSGIIWILNLIRNVVIAAVYREQTFLSLSQYDFLISLSGGDELLVSFYIIDTILAQFGSVIAISVLLYVILKFNPEGWTRLEEFYNHYFDKY